MQAVNFRDLLKFRLPKGWTAEYVGDGAMFREPTGIGVLILDVVDFECPAPATAEAAVDLLANYGRHEGREILHLTNGSAFVTYVERSTEPEALTAFVWEVVHAVADTTLRMGAFSFVVKPEAEEKPDVVKTVSMLTREIAQCAFLQSV